VSVNRKALEERSYELVVAGGGLAGLCAAVTAARKGIRTAIVQDRPVFGGPSSSETRVTPLGAANFQAWTRETGLIEEIVLEDRACNHEHFFDHGLTNTRWDLLLYEVARREAPRLELFFNTSVRGVETDGGRITAIHASQLGSEKEFCLRAEQYIDCTGDGTVGFLAGADFRYGRESRSEHGEPLAPLVADDVTMGSTITMRARDIGRVAPYTPPDWIHIYRAEEELGLKRKLYHIERESFGGYWWLEVANPFHQIDDCQAIREELHRHVLGVWNYLKNHSPEKERFATYALDWIGMVAGKRESRRLLGDVVVTEHDVHHDARWPDRVCTAGWYIDLHIPGGILNKQEPGERSHVDLNYKYWTLTPPFSLPLRAFHSRNVSNLWMAGRDISVTHVALGPVRVQSTTANMGQAVGTAAAYALRHGLTPREACQTEHVESVQQELLRDDLRVLGCRHTDAAGDLALGARASASSEAVLDFGEPVAAKWLPLDYARAQVLPISTERLESVSVYLRNSSAEARSVRAELYELERIWDRTPGITVATGAVASGGMASGSAATGAVATVPGGFEGWVDVVLNATVRPGRPHRLALFPAAGVSWAQGSAFPTGTLIQGLFVSQGGCEPRNGHFPSLQPHEVDLPAFAHWVQHPRGCAMAVRTSPIQRPFGPDAVKNGVAWPEDLPNLWISDPAQSFPQHVDLDFGRPAAFDTVRVSFDTDLHLIASQRPAFWRAPQCVADWRLLALSGGEWREIYAESGNYQRRRVVRFDPVQATALRLEVLSTNGDASARVYEISVERSGGGGPA